MAGVERRERNQLVSAPFQVKTSSSSGGSEEGCSLLCAVWQGEAGWGY